MDLGAVSNYKVLLVGDGIIDEYVYVTPIGKSIKENIISTSYEGHESFRGGVWAGAAHLKDFCKVVDVMTGPTIMRNKRFVDKTYNHKLFTVHEKKNGNKWNDFDIPSYDLVIVTDFGHGAITPELIERLNHEASFLAVNAQTNSTNFGFNLVTKFSRADFVVVDELEARLATHDMDSHINDICRKLNFGSCIITMGRNGAVGFDGEFHHAPAMTTTALDTMGSGDAFLCVTAPFAKAGFSMPELLKIGNAAGAIKCGIIGHQSSVTKESLKAYL